MPSVFPTSMLFLVQFSLENKGAESGFIPLLCIQSSRTLYTILKWFSNLSGHQNHLEHRVVAPPPEVDSVGLGPDYLHFCDLR